MFEDSTQKKFRETAAYVYEPAGIIERSGHVPVWLKIIVIGVMFMGHILRDPFLESGMSRPLGHYREEEGMMQSAYRSMVVLGWWSWVGDRLR